MRSREQGIALIAVLWVTVLLAALAAGMIQTTRTESQLARNLAESAKAEALADAGVYRAILALINQDPAKRWRADGRPYSFALGEGQIRLLIQDEGGKIDLNTGKDELLYGLFVTLGLSSSKAESLREAMVEFREANTDRDQDPTAAPADAGGLFTLPEDLRFIRAFSADLIHQISPFVTVHSWQTGIDPRTAPAQVLYSLPGIRPEQVAALLEARSVRGVLDSYARKYHVGIGARTANVDIVNHEFADDLLNSGQDWAESRAQLLSNDVLLVLTKFEDFFSWWTGRIYCVRSEARTNAGASFVREAVVALDRDRRGSYSFYLWRHGSSGAGRS